MTLEKDLARIRHDPRNPRTIPGGPHTMNSPMLATLLSEALIYHEDNAYNDHWFFRGVEETIDKIVEATIP